MAGLFKNLAIALLLGTLAARLLCAADWSNWRGPEHTGISRETDWTTNWPTAGPPVVWRAQVGTGFSSIAIAAGRAFTLGHQGEDDTAFCFDALTGQELWRFSYPAPLVDNLHEGGPAATPTVVDGRVYTLSKDGKLFCFDARDGKVLWNLHAAQEAGVAMPEWGFSSSALVLGKRLYIDVGSTMCVDALTGKVIWKTTGFRPGYGTPVPATIHGVACLAVLNNDALILVRMDDGLLLAKQPWETDYVTSATTPIVVDDTIFISTGYKRGCALFKLDHDKFKLIYESTNMSNHMANCVLLDGHLYGFDGNSHTRRLVKLTCIDYASGQQRWKHLGLGCGSLMAADGKLITLSDTGDLVIVRATPEKYDEIARTKVLDGRCWTVPVLAHGRVYCRDAEGHIVCVDLRPVK